MGRIPLYFGGFGVATCDNKNGPSGVVSATRPGPDPLSLAKNERG